MKKKLLTLSSGFTCAFYAVFVMAAQDVCQDHQHDDSTNAQPDVTVDAIDHSQHQTTVEVQSTATDHSQHQPTPEVQSTVFDHSQHQITNDVQTTPSVIEHEHMPEPMEVDHEAMDPMQMTQSAPGELRDPHAYSGGYELASGLYALESGSQIALADQTNFTGLWMDRLEYVLHDGKDATELEGHVWIGNSYNRLLLRTEAEIVNDKVENAEIDLLMSRAVSPFWDLQFGGRHQIVEDTHRHWATIGLNGLAPYWLEVDASLFISEQGQIFYDLEVEYEIRLTQRLVLQPRMDIHSFGKADKKLTRGAGLSQVKVGARLRYEFSRQIAPYLGVEQVSSYGETADLLPQGVDRSETHWVFGMKFWF